MRLWELKPNIQLIITKHENVVLAITGKLFSSESCQGDNMTQNSQKGEIDHSEEKGDLS